MTLEEVLIEKQYYKYTFMKEGVIDPPVRVLGEAYVIENQKEFSDLSFIRYAQGEVYFHNKDFESAIFKWENINNELEPWAKKNMADAYFELGLFSAAEDLYHSITSDSQVLTTELSLKLFNVYNVQGKMDKAVETIKEAVAYNPDHLDVATIAREFFEENEDWNNAVELAVNSASSTVSMDWFEILKRYSDEGKTKQFPPSYFSKVLTVLYIENQYLFEKLVSSLWRSYQTEAKDVYIDWIKEINLLLINMEDSSSNVWSELSQLYFDTYSGLLNGELLVKELSTIIPYHLENWLKIADSSKQLVVSASVLAWEEIFPSTFNQDVIRNAETLIIQSTGDIDVLEESLKLFQSILHWAELQDMQVDYSLKWMVRELLDLGVHHLLVTGSTESGKTDWVNSILGGQILGTPSASVIMYKDHDDLEIAEITENGMNPINSISEFHDAISKRMLIECKRPADILNKNQITIIEAPSVKEERSVKEFLLADTIVAVLNPDEYNWDEITELQNQSENVPIHFVISQSENLYNEQKITLLKEELHSRYPYAKVFINKNSNQQYELDQFIQNITKEIYVEEARTLKILGSIRLLMSTILGKRVEMENALNDSIKWDEDMIAKLGGAIHQLQDLESEKIKSITGSYQFIKNEIKQELSESIPKILKGCSSLINESSDFRKLHLELNEEMNSRIQGHLYSKVMPYFYTSIRSWIANAEEEFYQSRIFLEEMRNGFNTLYGKDQLQLHTDSKIIDDWRRDAERMKNGIRMEKVNILLRHTPSQVLLKSAGKLLGSLTQNKSMLSSRYKKFIENEDYQAIVDLVTEKFLVQFELFETAIERDVSMFFQEPLSELEKTVQQTLISRKENENRLNKMKSNPEFFQDPLTLFKVKLRQYEWIVDVNKEISLVR
ncbi:GTP-binding protein [Bacillus sp. Gen3]|nr:GTP-binding protein [Bacillus sp. Gen3]